MNRKIKVAVVVGDHPYDVPNFQKMFMAMDSVEAYIQNLQEFITCSEEIRKWYDVVLFYNFHNETPKSDDPDVVSNEKIALEQLGDTKQGIFLLHHAILAYPDWHVWSDICGIQNRIFDYHHDQNVNYEIIKSHPITSGVNNFSMIDETYSMDSAGADSDILITTDYSPSMKTILWTRKYKNSNVVCYESGHDNIAFSNNNFRKIAENAITWLVD